MKELMKQNHVMSTNATMVKKVIISIYLAHIYGNDTNSPIYVQIYPIPP